MKQMILSWVLPEIEKIDIAQKKFWAEFSADQRKWRQEVQEDRIESSNRLTQALHAHLNKLHEEQENKSVDALNRIADVLERAIAGRAAS